MQLSVLDLVPVRSDQTTGDALAATTSLARVADGLGFDFTVTGFWPAVWGSIVISLALMVLQAVLPQPRR